MHIHLPNKFRFLFAYCIVLIIVMISFITRETKKKEDYSHITGKIAFLNSRLGDLPNRDFGKYRYLKLENYPYPFEIYADNQTLTMDSLHAGDLVTAYFYDSEDTKEDELNRALQYLQKGDKLYFTRTDFQKNLGYVMILILLGSAYFFYYLYKKGKIEY